MKPWEEMPKFSSRSAIVGWRGWNLIHPHFLMTANTVWLPQERYEAFCYARYHEEGTRIPVERCTCGVYAFTYPHLVKEQGYTSQQILGEVWLWGKVIEHERGYKAEYAYPKKLYAKTEELFWEENQFNSIASMQQLPRDLRYKRYRELVEFIAFRYNLEFEIVDESHPIYIITPEEQRRRAELERAKQLQVAQERAQARQKNARMKMAAMNLPPTIKGMGFKSLWEQITWEAEQEVAKRLQPKPPKGQKP